MLSGAIMKAVIVTFLAALLSSAIITDASAQNLGKILIVSKVLQLSADTERSGTTSSTIKQFVVPYAGMVRVKWEIKSGKSSRFANASVVGQIGTCSSSTLMLTYQAGSCELRVVAGDLIDVFVKGEPGQNGTNYSLAFIRNVRVFYSIVDSQGAGAVLND
jgi:hypothetical protein